MDKAEQILNIKESIRKRPGMYLGGVDSKGIINLLKGLLVDCINTTKDSKNFFHITILSKFKFEIDIKTSKSVSNFLNTLKQDFKDYKQIHLKLLDALNKHLCIIENSSKEVILKFTLDTNIFKESVDYLELSESVLQLAYLNRNSEFLITDNRLQYKNQNYYSFPDGIKYLYDRTVKDALGKPEFEINFNDSINGLEYQIFLGYRTDWYPPASIASFANDINTICGGSLVNGILTGLINGCKHYVKTNELKKFKVKKKKFTNGLIIVASVRGKEFKYGGSFKETLEDEKVEGDIKKRIKELTLDFIDNNKEKADKFLWRFDETQLTSGMFE
jgi:DNA gyrase/topoisomerase IV subunit B